MNKKMLINATHPEEHRVAIVEDGLLVELDIEITSREQTRGNIYKGVVVRIEPGLQAAFIDFGGTRPGFLQIGEIHPSFFKNAQGGENKGRPRINDLLRRGQELLVQVVKEERGTKGAALTTYLSLPGRYMVLMPESDTKGVSRKIEQESQRKKLKETMNSLELPDNIGYIVRTAGIGQKKTELKRDVDYLIRVYEKILELAKEIKAPALVYKESNLVIRSIRDYFSSEIDEVLVDDPGAAQEAKEFFEEVMPEYAKLVRLHQERRPLFARYQIEEQIDAITRNKVSLPSGGSIVIDATEALVAVDVNSGKMAGEQGVEATAFKTNMEAAAEIARQLRLRDLGGLIVIDFIDMRDRKHDREVEKCLKDALKTDKARVTVGRISQFGLLEMSRQRIKSVLAAAAYLPCPHCGGSGLIKSAETQALDFLRRVYTGMAKGHIGRVEAEIPLDVASYILNHKREELLEIEKHHSASIFIKGRPDFVSGQMEISFHKREKETQLTPQQYIEAATGRTESSPETEKTEKEETAESLATELQEQQPAPAAKEETARKRRRPRKRRKPQETNAGPASQAGTAAEPAPQGQAAEAQEIGTAAASTPQAGEQESAATSGQAPASGETQKKPQPRKAAPAAASAESERNDAVGQKREPQPAAAEEKTEPQPAPPKEDEKPQRKPRRRRKPAAAAKTAPAEPPSAETAGEKKAALPAAAPAEPSPQPAPQEKADSAAQVDKATTGEQTPPVKKPARRPRTRKTATAAKSAEETRTPAAGSEPAGDAAASGTEKPRPKRPARKRPAAKKTAEPSSSAE
jgi:ribonuclease E